MTTKEQIGARIKSAIVQKNRKQKEVAAKVGIGPTILSNYINGKNCPASDVLARLATELGVSSDWLLGLTEEAPTDQPEVQIDSLGDVMQLLFKIDSVSGFQIHKIEGEKVTDTDESGLIHTYMVPDLYCMCLSLESNASLFNDILREWMEIKNLTMDTDIIKNTLMPAWKERTIQLLSKLNPDGTPAESVSGRGDSQDLP